MADRYSTEYERTEYEQPGGVYEQMSLGQLLSHLSNEFGEMVRNEVDLAKVEIKQDARHAAKAGGLFGGAAILGYLALLLASFAAGWGLSELMHPGWAFLVIAIVYAIAAGAFYLGGKGQMEKADFTPERTMRTVREDVEWAKEQVR